MFIKSWRRPPQEEEGKAWVARQGLVKRSPPSPLETDLKIKLLLMKKPQLFHGETHRALIEYFVVFSQQQTDGKRGGQSHSCLPAKHPNMKRQGKGMRVIRQDETVINKQNDVT